jgi:hypothetical protein
MLLVTFSPTDARVQRGGVIDTGGKFATGVFEPKNTGARSAAKAY